jgi:hypothetical protein
MRLRIQNLLAFFVPLSFCFTAVTGTTFAREPEAVAMCKALAPSDTQDVSESFKGKVEGKLDGLISRLAGGVAAIEGEYSKLAKDTLKDYPESHKLYVWQKLIYLACVNNSAIIDINELAKAYLVGPTSIDLSIKTKKSDIKIEFLGLDVASSWDTLINNGTSFSDRARLPDLVFSYTNVSDKHVHVDLSGCSLIDFKYPEPIPITTSSAGSQQKTISAVTGTTSMNPVGATQVIVPPDQKKTKSYSIFSVDALSFEDRRQRKSVCRFQVGNGMVWEPIPIEVDLASDGRYVSR